MTQKKGINKLSSFHFNENCSPFLDSLCEPLFKNFGITHFGCIRILENGQMLRIANNKEWTRRYFHYEFYNDLDIYAMENIPINERNFKILSGPPLSDHCKMLCSEFNIWNFMLVYEKFPTYGELWFFGTCRENTQILDFYINNMHVFQHFIVYFKNKAIHLLDMNDSSHLIQTFIRPFTENLSGETQAQKFTTELN